MNDDDFEKKLHALTGALHRPDPTPAWKADILARARREADAAPVKRLLPPRWLLLSWVAGWAFVVGLNLTSPTSTSPSSTSQNVTHSAEPPPPSSPTLLAYHQTMNATLDLNR